MHNFKAQDKSSRPRLKVLISAYACSPSRGSESGVGWGWVEAISKYHDVYVLTAAQFESEIEEELSRRPELRSRIEFHYIPRKRYLRFEKLWPPAYLLSYKNQWQRAAYEVGLQLHKRHAFDIVHQLTYVGFRVPGFLWMLGVPFVWGPIGGLEQTTWALIPALGLRGGIHFLARNLLNDRDRRCARLPRQAFAKADGGIIAATTGIQKAIRRFYGLDSVVVSEIGLPPLTKEAPIRRLPGEPLRLLWCGNLIPLKALPFLLSSLQLLPPEVDWQLTVIGDGPCQEKWKRLAQKHGISGRCLWLNRVSRKTVLQRMQEAHILVITSVHDLTSTVLVEALASGLPVICPDHCGFTDAITSECGITVPASKPRHIVKGIRDAIIKLNTEDERYLRAKGALAQSAKFRWETKAAIVSEIYYKKMTFRPSRSPKTNSEVSGGN